MNKFLNSALEWGLALSIVAVTTSLWGFGIARAGVVGHEMREPEQLPVEEVQRVEQAEVPEAQVEVIEVVEVLQPEQSDPEVVLDQDILEYLAIGIYREAGADYICDDCRFRVGDVMLNRVADSRYPDSLEGVLTQKGQYGNMHHDGITWPARADKPEESHAVLRAYHTAEELLRGEHSELYGQGYIFQSEFPNLGHDVFEHCGIYFAKG